MKNLIRVVSLLSIITIAACQKDKLEAPVLPEASDVVEAPIDSSHISGHFRVVSTYLIENDSVLIPNDTVTSVEFNDAGSGPKLSVNAVSVNGVPLPYDPNRQGYTTPFYINSIEAANWNVKGNTIIPDFNYINQRGMPVYELFKFIPNTIDRKKDFIFPMTGALNTTYMSVHFNDHVALGIDYGNSIDYTTVIIPVRELSLLTPNPLTDLEIRFQNYSYVNLGGRTFCFINEIIFRKKVKLL